MPIARSMLLSVSLIAPAFAADLTVDPQGDIKSVQAAIDAAPADGATIRIKPGEYRQRLTVPKEKSHLHFIGLGGSPDKTVLIFNAKASDPKPDGNGTLGTTGSSTVYFHGNDCSAENLTFANDAGFGAGQGVALKTTGDRLVFERCRFLGNQDTLYPTAGRCYFYDCYVAGTVDFIFGNATAVFEGCEIHSLGPGYLTAANTAPSSPFGYVFLNCKLTAEPDIKPGSIFLGRPWQWDRSSSAVIFAHTTIGPHIDPRGWNPWDEKKNTSPAEHTRYSEIDSHDADGRPADLSGRVTWTHPLDQAALKDLTAEHILAGSDSWKPTTLPTR